MGLGLFLASHVAFLFASSGCDDEQQPQLMGMCTWVTPSLLLAAQGGVVEVQESFGWWVLERPSRSKRSGVGCLFCCLLSNISIHCAPTPLCG